MPRVLSTDSNGDLSFTEKVEDDDGDNVTHPLTNVVQLEKIDGSPAPDPTPSWLSATVNQIGLVNGRWEEEVTVTITDAESNLSVGEYTFKFEADDGYDSTVHRTVLEVR